MVAFLSRRRLLAAGGIAAALPFAPSPGRAQTPPLGGELITLRSPVRVYDSRSDLVPLGGAKLQSGHSVAVTVSSAFLGEFALSVFMNVTVTQTEGSGFLVVRGSDLSGEEPLPPTSNVNWWTGGLTLANLVLTTVGGENAVEVHCDGGGRTHLVCDVQGYVPFVA